MDVSYISTMLCQQQCRVINEKSPPVFLLTLAHSRLCLPSKLESSMAALRYYTTVLTLTSGSAFVVFLINRYLPSRNAKNLPRATQGHEKSAAVVILNPRTKRLFQHRIAIDIPATRLKHGLDSDEILARFTQGFFGGWIFSPERWFFQLTRLSVTNLDGKCQFSSWISVYIASSRNDSSFAD